MVDVSDERFEDMVNDALEKVPEKFVSHMRNLVIQVEDARPGHPETMGLYVGVSLPERTFHHSGYLPDAIFLYRESLKRICSTEEELAHEVEVTVFHELGHYFGFDDDELHHLGWG